MINPILCHSMNQMGPKRMSIAELVLSYFCSANVSMVIDLQGTQW